MGEILITEPVPPIVIDDLGELLIYPTIEMTCLEVETIDAREGVLEAFDSEGRRLELSARGEVVSLAIRSGSGPDPAELERRLRLYIRPEWLPKMGLANLDGIPLSEMLQSLLEYERDEASTSRQGWGRGAIAWLRRSVLRSRR
ncbi:hypothetical protein GCM10009655_14750 [Rhodoglobus aureus]|uniref:Uncharacterized protein n=1 Tax=Rhodoglobus aureus TaxID=191497 RepID=A0ABN1VNQ3_9MICO